MADDYNLLRQHRCEGIGIRFDTRRNVSIFVSAVAGKVHRLPRHIVQGGRRPSPFAGRPPAP